MNSQNLEKIKILTNDLGFKIGAKCLYKSEHCVITSEPNDGRIPNNGFEIEPSVQLVVGISKEGVYSDFPVPVKSVETKETILNKLDDPRAGLLQKILACDLAILFLRGI